MMSRRPVFTRYRRQQRDAQRALIFPVRRCQCFAAVLLIKDTDSVRSVRCTECEPQQCRFLVLTRGDLVSVAEVAPGSVPELRTGLPCCAPARVIGNSPVQPVGARLFQNNFSPVVTDPAGRRREHLVVLGPGHDVMSPTSWRLKPLSSLLAHREMAIPRFWRSVDRPHRYQQPRCSNHSTKKPSPVHFRSDNRHCLSDFRMFASCPIISVDLNLGFTPQGAA